MPIAKMSTMHNSYRYFTIAVNDYENRCMKGIIYHGGRAPGIRYENFLEMVLHMNRIFDCMSCPKQTMELRRFSGTSYPVPAVEECDHFENGRLVTFQIYVKFRYNASWQGDIIWQDGQNRAGFESLIQMMQLVEQIVTGQNTLKKGMRLSKTCQIAVNSYEKGCVAGTVQNAFINYLEEFKGTFDLADAMVHLIEVGIKKDESGGQKVISEKTWEAYRLGGRKATFLVKVLFREHSTWQGVICWRETGEKQAFRSFMEMMILMVSAVESVIKEDGCEDRCTIENDKRALMQG